MLTAWYRGSGWLRLLRPLSALYAFLAGRRRQRYLASPERVWQPPVPLIVVGNITLGGTGKTPMCIWLVEHLRQHGWRPGIISRGYGATVAQYPHLIDPLCDMAVQVGDEPLLLASRCGVPVVIDPDRPRAARHLLSTCEVDLIISDDGLQHYALGRQIEIVMLDAVRALGNGRCLPEGPLREPATRLQQVDFVVSTGASSDAEGRHAMALSPLALVNMLSGERLAIADWPAEKDVVAVAGIGNPQRFFATLQQLGFSPETHAFADHAHYNAASFAAFDQSKSLFMTEKDAIKCAGFARANWWYLSIEACLSDAFESALLARLSVLRWPAETPRSSNSGVV